MAEEDPNPPKRARTTVGGDEWSNFLASTVRISTLKRCLDDAGVMKCASLTLKLPGDKEPHELDLRSTPRLQNVFVQDVSSGVHVQLELFAGDRCITLQPSHYNYTAGAQSSLTVQYQNNSQQASKTAKRVKSFCVVANAEGEPERAAPLGWSGDKNLQLRPEQKRALHWMVQREQWGMRGRSVGAGAAASSSAAVVVPGAPGPRDAGAQDEDGGEGGDVVARAGSSGAPSSAMLRTTLLDDVTLHTPGGVSWGRVSAYRTNRVPGGVLADKIGTGKTVTALALIRSQQVIEAPPGSLPTEPPRRIFGDVEASPGAPPPGSTCPPGYFDLRTTNLICVPGHLLNQWQGEVQKFLSSAFWKIVAVRDITDLKRLTVGELRSAAIVIMPYKLFEHEQIYKREVELADTGGSWRNVHPSPQTREKLREKVENLKNQDKTISSTVSSFRFVPLLMCFFRRVIFDEVHEIDWESEELYSCQRKARMRHIQAV